MHPHVQAMNTSTASGLIVAQVGYTIVHILTFAITLQFWNGWNIYYLIMFVAEEIPNVYNFLVCICVFIDFYLP